MIRKYFHYFFLLFFVLCAGVSANNYQKFLGKGQFQKALREMRSDRSLVVSEKVRNDQALLEYIVPVFNRFKRELTLKQKSGVINRKQQILLNRVMIKGLLKLFDNNIEVAKQYFVQGLYFHSDPAFKEIMKKIGFPEGSYLVWDQRDSMLSQADQFFYGGAFLKALENLSFLADVDESNSLIFEKLGSCHYMINQKQQAVDNWQTALFLNPKKRSLRPLIKHVKKQIEEESKARYLAKKNRAASKKVKIKDPMSMGVFRTRGAANEFAQQYIEKNIPTEVLQREDQKWQVQVSKKALRESQKGSGS